MNNFAEGHPKVADRIKILFVIPSLEQGGAERQLVELLKALNPNKFNLSVVTCYPGGAFRPEVESLSNIMLYSLEKHTKSWLSAARELNKVLKAEQPDVVHGYMGVANELGWLMAKRHGCKCVWGIRTTNMELSEYGWKSRLSFWVSAKLSRFVDLIIYNSRAGQHHHHSLGYRPKQSTVIANGINTCRFSPNREQGQAMRDAWGIPTNRTLIGLVGRLDPVKGHPVFLQAAAKLLAQNPGVHFVVVGDGDAQYRQSLVSMANSLNLVEHITWAGFEADMAAATNALDIATSASGYGEGFSNTVGEAMACGVPCVVTDVGDSASIVGNTGVVVAANDAQALADGWASLISLTDSELEQMGRAAREHIVAHFQPSTLADKTEQALINIARPSVKPL